MSERSTSWPEVTAWRTFSGALPPMPRSLSSNRNWTAEGSPAATSGQMYGQGRGQDCWLAQTLRHCLARLVGAVTKCVVGGVWVWPRVVDSFGQLGGAVVLEGSTVRVHLGWMKERRLSSPDRMSERSTSWPKVTAWRTFSGFRALMPRSLSSVRNWTAEGSPAASGQVSGQGRGQCCWFAQTLRYPSRVGPSGSELLVLSSLHEGLRHRRR